MAFRAGERGARPRRIRRSRTPARNSSCPRHAGSYGWAGGCGIYGFICRRGAVAGGKSRAAVAAQPDHRLAGVYGSQLGHGVVANCLGFPGVSRGGRCRGWCVFAAIICGRRGTRGAKTPRPSTSVSPGWLSGRHCIRRADRSGASTALGLARRDSADRGHRRCSTRRYRTARRGSAGYPSVWSCRPSAVDYTPEESAYGHCDAVDRCRFSGALHLPYCRAVRGSPCVAPERSDLGMGAWWSGRGIGDWAARGQI